MITYISTQKMMALTFISLIPAIVVRVAFFGFSQLISLILMLMLSFFLELGFAKLSKNSSQLPDLSYLLTALILWLSVMPNAPILELMLSLSFGLVFAKYMFGGTGLNIFNPAMLGFLFMLLSFPNTTYQLIIDGVSHPTELSSENKIINNSYTIFLHISYLVGGIILLATRVISFRTPTFTLIGIMIALLASSLIKPIDYSILIYGGSLVFLVFFIATDPSTTPQHRLAQLIIAILIGAITIYIRAFSDKYPDGVAFAIILANSITPMIDRLCQKYSKL